MFQRDYIMRNVEQLSSVLVKILKSKAAGDLQEAESQIAAAGKLFLGFDIDLIRNLSEESALALVKQRDEGDAGAYVVAAELFREQGDLLEVKSGAHAGHDSYIKSLSMYLEGWLGNPQHRTETHSEKITDLYERLKRHEMSGRMLGGLLHYFEMTGEYALAEDVLFRWIGDEDGHGVAAGDNHLVDDTDLVVHVDLVAEGIAFYLRLLSKPDADLAGGKLPRDEVEEGLEMLRGMIVR